MAVGYIKPAGGLSAADRALLAPENIRSGVSIFGVTGALISAKAIAAFTSFAGWLDDWQSAVMLRCSGLGYGYVDAKATYADTIGTLSMTIPIKAAFRGYMVAETGNIGLTYNGAAVSTNAQDPTVFTAGGNLVLSAPYTDNSRTILSCYLMLVQ